MDEKLVELVGGELVRAVGEWYGRPRAPWEKFYQFLGQRAVASINTSGTHWVAPWSATEGDAETSWIWDDMRDAYLAEQEKRDG